MTTIVDLDNVELIREDGYVNATALCKAGGKRFPHWNRSSTSKTYLQALAKRTGIPVLELIQTTMSGINQNRGTWVHHKVALQLAMWISSEFAIEVSDWIDEWKLSSYKNEARYTKSLSELKPDPYHKTQEKEIQTKLHDELGGDIEVNTKFGYIDLLTSTELIEIKDGKLWKHGVGQLLAYQTFYPNHSLRLHLFDFHRDEDIIQFCRGKSISVTLE